LFEINTMGLMTEDKLLVVLTVLAVAVSYSFDRKKTVSGLRKGASMLVAVLPQFLLVMVFVSLVLTLISKETIVATLGNSSGGWGTALAAIIGSIALIPGPIAYPLAGVLVDQGVPLGNVAVFTTTLMMVGVLTFPMEKAYLGTRLAILRNVLSFIGAIGIGLVIGAVL
jgi:uncharacterized membrane protein YraQ (UPF0718 family)